MPRLLGLLCSQYKNFMYNKTIKIKPIFMKTWRFFLLDFLFFVFFPCIFILFKKVSEEQFCYFSWTLIFILSSSLGIPPSKQITKSYFGMETVGTIYSHMFIRKEGKILPRNIIYLSFLIKLLKYILCKHSEQMRTMCNWLHCIACLQHIQ